MSDAPERIDDIFHDEKIRIWAQEILETLAMQDMLKINSYDEKVEAFCAVMNELRSIGKTVADRADLSHVTLLAAAKVVGALLQAEMTRSGGKPFTGTWSIPALEVRTTCSEALDNLNAALEGYSPRNPA